MITDRSDSWWTISSCRTRRYGFCARPDTIRLTSMLACVCKITRIPFCNSFSITRAYRPPEACAQVRIIRKKKNMCPDCRGPSLFVNFEDFALKAQCDLPSPQTRISADSDVRPSASEWPRTSEMQRVKTVLYRRPSPIPAQQRF